MRLLDSALLCFTVTVCLLTAAAAEGDQVSTTGYRFLGGEKVRVIAPAIAGGNFEQVVSDEGLLSSPNGIPINVHGKTLAESRQIIAQQLEKETTAKHLEVGLMLLETPPRKVYVAGEVRSPKSITLTPGTPLNLLGALQEVGGITEAGDATQVNILQAEPDGTQKVVTIDATTLIQPKRCNLGPRLQPGDVVVVPRAERFLLTGELNRTGIVYRNDLFLAPGELARVSRVILSAGLKPSANRNNIYVLRPNGESRQLLSVSLEAREKGSQTADDDPVVKDGDIVFVGATTAGKSAGVAIMGLVHTPGLYQIGEGLKLSRLLVLAGGLSDNAKGSAVRIYRAPSKAPIKVNVEAIIKDGDFDKDMDLKDGDWIYVGEKLF